MEKTENKEIFGQFEQDVSASLGSKINEFGSLNNIAQLKSKISEFSSYLFGPGRLQLLYVNKSENEELIFLLLNMKKQLKHILTELGKFRNRKEYSFKCVVCNEQLIIPQLNFWKVLQNHEHFEELYNKFLSEGILPMQENIDCYNLDTEDSLQLSSMEVSAVCNENDIGNDSETYLDENDNGNDSEETVNSLEFYLSTEQLNETDVNSFRFNFVPSYYNAVQSTLYPEKLIQSLKKYDPTIYPTVIAVAPSRSACLLCCCDLVNRSRKMSRQFFLEHISGNKHMRQASLIENINGLINFHETWLNKDHLIQAHQVYFRPYIDKSLKCILCGKNVSSDKVELHILDDLHKSNVMECFYKNINCFYLLDLQVELYGIQSKPNNNEKEASIVSPVSNKEKNRKIKPKKERRNLSQSNVNEQPEESPHNIIKSVENPSSQILSELLPHRYKSHSNFFVNQGNVIKCQICKVKVTADLHELILHIINKGHLELSRKPIKSYNYYCEVCNLKIADEYKWLKHFAEAFKWHSKIPESRRSKTAEYECTKCSTVIFGDELSLSRHLYTKGVRRKAAETKLAPSLLKVFKSQELIEMEAARLVSEANNTLKCNEATVKCCTTVEQILQIIFKDCKAYPFGSRISGLGDQKSDLDLFLDIGDMYTGYSQQDSLSQMQIVKKVHNAMCKVKEEFQDVHQIPTARTPIVKFHHKKTNIDCDLSFRHGLSVENTKFLRFCFDLQPVAQPFILILKMWSQQNNLSEYITTYALAIMAIFYLQSKAYLLSVKKLRQLSDTKGLIIAGWETLEYTLPIDELKKFVLPYPDSLVQLLKEFFLFYLKFPYENDVICPLLGQCIKKKAFDDNGKNLPPEMKSYCLQLKSEEPEFFRNTTPMCVQDPFDLSHNLTKALQAGTLSKFKILCELSHNLINSL